MSAQTPHRMYPTRCQNQYNSRGRIPFNVYIAPYKDEVLFGRLRRTFPRKHISRLRCEDLCGNNAAIGKWLSQ